MALPGSKQPKQPWDSPKLSRADKVITFIQSLPCTSGPLAGKNFVLHEWQKKFIRSVYKTTKTGERRVRTAVLSVGRSNGKTALAATLALCHLAGPESESRGEVYSAANDRFQSSRVFNELAAIIQRTPWLNGRCSIRRYPKEIEDFVTGSLFVSLSADAPTKAGLAPSFVIVDELGQARNRELYDVLATAMGKRAEPLLMVISTQAPRDEAVLSTLIDYGLRVNRGEVKDDSFHLTLYAAPLDANPWSIKTWRLANPALGEFRSLEDVKRLAAQAQKMPAAELSFKNLILNMRCDSVAHFLNVIVWKACGEAVDEDALRGRPCFAGLDLGATRDMTALVLVFANAVGRIDSFDVLPFCWLPGETLEEHENNDRMPYTLWARQGYLQTFEGRTTDPKAVALKIAELHGLYNIQALAFDRWRIEDIKRELDAIGCTVTLVPWGQGFKDMGFAVDALERFVEEKNIRHGGHPVLGMAAGNAKIEKDAAGNRKLSKRKSVGRIDPLVAMCMALGVATRPVPPLDVRSLIG
jgi:phage terminase large subunit-like protein